MKNAGASSERVEVMFVSDDRISEKWSDPLVGLQVDEFRKYVNARHRVGVAAHEVADAAELLCEWSRTLLSRTFGRTTSTELNRITALFAKTADQIDEWAGVVKDEDELTRIRTYSLHIRQRTGSRGVPVGRAEFRAVRS
jgi:hypothetical protein